MSLYIIHRHLSTVILEKPCSEVWLWAAKVLTITGRTEPSYSKFTTATVTAEMSCNCWIRGWQEEGRAEERAGKMTMKFLFFPPVEPVFRTILNYIQVLICKPWLAFSRQSGDNMISWYDSILQMDLHTQTHTKMMETAKWHKKIISQRCFCSPLTCQILISYSFI